MATYLSVATRLVLEKFSESETLLTKRDLELKTPLCFRSILRSLSVLKGRLVEAQWGMDEEHGGPRVHI